MTDADGKEIARGRLPQDGQEHPLRIAVPRAGLYWFEFNDQAAGWSIRIAAGRPAAVALSRSSPPAHLGHMQRMYFFVLAAPGRLSTIGRAVRTRSTALTGQSEPK